MTYRRKTQVLVLAWLTVIAVLFGYVFSLVDVSNQKILQEIQVQQLKYEQLLAEQKSYLLARQDLDKLATLRFRPDEFFSRDVQLVSEIRMLEELAENLEVDFNIGLAGEAKNLAKAPDTSEELIVPYSLQLSGSFAHMIQYLEVMERLPFVTSVKTINFSPAAAGDVNLSLAAQFYIKK